MTDKIAEIREMGKSPQVLVQLNAANDYIPRLCNALEYVIKESNWVPTEKDLAKID